MSKFQFVVFDWDGTLMDSIGRIVSSMQRTAEHVGLSVPSEQATKDIIGLSLEPAIERLFGVLDSPKKQTFLERYKDEYVRLNTVASPMFDDAVNSLEALRSSNVQLGVATGKARRGLDRVWQETNMAQFFPYSRCANESKGKPNPDMLIELMHEAGYSPDNTVMVGDSIHDMKMASAAGVFPIGVTMGAHRADQLKAAGAEYIASSLTELSNFILKERL